MGAISGMRGLVTGPSYVSLVRGWAAELSAAEQDLTSLQPTNNHQVLMVPSSPGGVLLKGGGGTYRCRLAVPETTVVTSGSPWAYNAEEWNFSQTCDPLEVTPLGAEWRTFVPGLKRSSCGITCYLDDTKAGPIPGQGGTVVLTAAAGKSYSVPYVVNNISPAVDVEGSDRKVSIGMLASGNPTITSLPSAGEEVSAVFSTDAARNYSGDIIITSVAVKVNRRESMGEIEVGFVFTGEIESD